MSRIADVPIYAQRNDRISGKLYNLWRRAKVHFPMPLRIAFPDNKTLAIILEKHEWICVDESQNDLPILAWVEFEDQGRDTLHTDVQCKLNYYHYAASKLRVLAMNQMEQELDTLLKNDNQK